MKVNKITVIICTGFTALFALLIIFIELYATQFACYAILQSILSGLFTGFIASLTISIIGYWHERSIIIEKTDGNIRSLYANMKVISKLIGDILPQIHTETNLSMLHFERISGLSSLNVDFISEMHLNLFNPFCKKKKLSKVFIQLNDFQQAVYNIKNISMDIQIKTLEYTNQLLKLRNSETCGIKTAPNDIRYLNELKNLINIKTAKFHEYTTAQTIELEKIAKIFYDCKRNKQTWDTIKSNLMLQIEDIVRK